MNAPMIRPPAEPTDPEIDPRAFRNCLGSFATGVTVITTRGDGGAPVGLVVNSFASVSLSPALILWSIDLAAPSLGAFRQRDSFAVNVMGAQDKDLTMRFARPATDKFAGVDWHPGHDEVPLLDRALATIECRTEQRIVAGDHEIYIGRVQGFVRRDGDPLVFHRGVLCGIGDAV